MQRGQQDFADSQVVDQPVLVVDDVDDIERLAVAAVGADVIEHMAHGPLLADHDVVGGHQSADAMFAIIEQGAGDDFLLGIEQVDQPLGLLGRKLGKQRRPVIGRHLVQDVFRLFHRQRLEHLLLGVDIEVREGLGGQGRLDQPQDVNLFGGRECIDKVGQVRRVPAIDDLAQGVVIVGFDQLSNLGERQLSQHRVSTFIPLEIVA